MKEHPILMTTANVKAILEGRKTQTRRVIKRQPVVSDGFLANVVPLWLKLDEYVNEYCRYKVGDRLWVRETLEHSNRGIPTRYAADGCPVMRDGESIDWPFRKSPLPSIFMPRWASRINLEITGLRVERLQEISEKDYFAEGLRMPPVEECAGDGGSRFININGWWKVDFKNLWDSINAKRGYSWESKPWVWVIQFPRYGQ